MIKRASKVVAVILALYIVLSLVASILVANGLYSVVEHRTGLLVVELIQGTATSEREDGKLNGIDDSGFYICYSPDTVSIGDTVTTLIVYNPLTSYTDDFARLDVYVDSNN